MIIQNAIMITEDWPKVKYLVSSFVHDFQTHTFHSGKRISVDGGKEYIKRVYDGDIKYGINWMEYCLDDKEPFYVIKDKLLWGSRGKDGNQPLTWVRLMECSIEHLQSILKNSLKHPSIYKEVIENILSEKQRELKLEEMFSFKKQDIIHKAKRPKYYYVNPTVCGVNLNYQDSNRLSRTRWNKVTCPNCLTLRKNGV